MGRYSTLLPSTLGAASSWNAKAARLYGDVIGRELRAQGYNMSIGGGVDIAEVYAEIPAAAGEHYKRLVAFDRVKLKPGESKTVTVDLNPLCLSIYNVQKNAMEEIPGEYKILAGPSSADTPLSATFSK